MQSTLEKKGRLEGIEPSSEACHNQMLPQASILAVVRQPPSSELLLILLLKIFPGSELYLATSAVLTMNTINSCHTVLKWGVLYKCFAGIWQKTDFAKRMEFLLGEVFEAKVQRPRAPQPAGEERRSL